MLPQTQPEQAVPSATEPAARCRTTDQLVPAVVDPGGVGPDHSGAPDIRNP